MYKGCLACPVPDRTGNVVAAHYRLKNGEWNRYPTGYNTRPIIIGKLLSPRLAKVLNAVSGIRTQVWRMVLFVVLAVLGFIVAAIHIGIFDRWYLYRGRVGRLIAQAAPPRKEG